MPGGWARRGVLLSRGLSCAWARCGGRVAGASRRSLGAYPPVPLRVPAALEGVHAYPGGGPRLSAKWSGAPRRSGRAPRKPSRGPFAATEACRAEWAGLSASCSRGCRRQGPGMPRIGGVYAWGWRGARFSGSRVLHSHSRAPRGMGGRAGVPVGRAFEEVGRAAGAVASTSGRVARIAPAVGAGGSGGSGVPAGPPRASGDLPLYPIWQLCPHAAAGVPQVQSHKTAGPQLETESAAETRPPGRSMCAPIAPPRGSQSTFLPR